MKQNWKPISGYKDVYWISDQGFVKSNRKILKNNLSSNGYLLVSLSLGGTYKSARIHRLVALSFIPNPDNLPEVNHKDGNKLNNHVSNLEWCTRSENERHAHRIGLKKMCRKVSDEQVSEIRSLSGVKTQIEIASIYGISRSHVQRIIYLKSRA